MRPLSKRNFVLTSFEMSDHLLSNRVLLAGLSLGGIGVGSYLLLRPRPRPMQLLATHPQASIIGFDDDDYYIPEEMKDTITLCLIDEPVILVATGQLYSYESLKGWFSNGGACCPKTNIEVVDIEIARCSWMKDRIREWQKCKNLLPVDEEDKKRAAMTTLASINPSLPEWIKTIRSDTGHPRTLAITELFKLMQLRESMDPSDTEYESKHRLIREEVMEDCIWLLRYGDAYSSGVACSILSFSDTPEEVSWLSRCATFPAVLLLNSMNRYSSQAATRILYNLVKNNNDVGKKAVKRAGGVTSLISIIKEKREDYGFSRSRAAAALAELVNDDDVRYLVIKQGLFSLVDMIQSADRWEVRDSATCLSRLKISEEDLAQQGLSSSQLLMYRFCSQAWLDGKASSPSDGMLESEAEAHRAWIAFETTGVEIV